jgi:Kef-type K+ transport system membrane component KefB
MFFSLSVLLGSAKFMGELTRKIRQPAILGEIFAGILLGPTVLGHFRPQWYSWIFPTVADCA